MVTRLRLGGVLGTVGLVAVVTNLALVPVQGYAGWLVYEEVLSGPSDPESISALFRNQATVSAAIFASIAVAMGVLALGLYTTTRAPSSGTRTRLATILMILGGLLYLPWIGLSLLLFIFSRPSIGLEEARWIFGFQWATRLAVSFAIPTFLLGLWTMTFGRQVVAVPPAAPPLPTAVSAEGTDLNQ